MPTLDLDFSVLSMVKALHLLVKAGAHIVKHRGPQKNHKYIWREWSAKRNEWDYTYSEVPHFSTRHGDEHAYEKESHSLDIHQDSRNLRHTPEQAYNHKYLMEQLKKFKEKIARSGKKDCTAHFKDINGQVMFSAEHNPRKKTHPVTVYYSHGSKIEGKRPPALTLRAFEGMVRGINRRVYYDDQHRPLAYAMRVNMAPELEQEYAEVSEGKRKARPSAQGWRSGPRPVKLVFYDDNPYAKEQGWAGQFQYFPDGDKLHQFITERISLLKMGREPQKGKTKVADPGYDSKGVFHSNTAQIEDGSIGWVAESQERQHTARKRLVRRLDLESKFSTKEKRTNFLYELILEHLGMAYKVSYDAIRWMRSRGGHYEFYPEDIDEIVEAATGIPGQQKTGLLEAIDYYNPYREFEDDSGKKKASKLITHATPFMRAAARNKLIDIVAQKNAERRTGDFEHVKAGVDVSSGKEYNEDELLDNFAYWRKKQLSTIENKMKTTQDTNELASLKSAKDILPKRMSDADDFYYMFSSYDWAIPPDDPSLYRDAKHVKVPFVPTQKAAVPWREFVQKKLPNKAQVAAILAVIPDGPGQPSDHDHSVKVLTEAGILDRTSSVDERKKKAFSLVTRGLTMLQQLSPDEMNEYFSSAKSRKIVKSLQGMIVDVERAAMESVLMDLGL